MTRLLLSLFIFTLSVNAQSRELAVSVNKTITDNLVIPWGMAQISPNQLLVTQRGGDIVLVDMRSGKKTQVSGGPKVLVKGQGGLLDVKKSPNYHQDGWLYFTYVKAIKGQGATTLARAKLDKNELVQWQDLLITKSRTRHGRHFGSRIAFDHQGHVFFSIGDRANRDNGQDLMTHAGSILRLNLDGSVPRDNPFVGRKDALPELYSVGHRNPQGLAYDMNSKHLWAIEHGPRGGDELNLIKPGLNYGWPIVSHGKEYVLPMAVGEATSMPGYQDPVQVYIPSIAPSSLLLLPLADGKPQFFIGALKLTHINHLVIDASVTEHRYLTSLGKRIRNIIAGDNGSLLVATDDGLILQVSLAR